MGDYTIAIICFIFCGFCLCMLPLSLANKRKIEERKEKQKQILEEYNQKKQEQRKKEINSVKQFAGNNGISIKDLLTERDRLYNLAVRNYASEYRPENVPKDGAKVIDITAAIVDHREKCVRWHLYDIKATLAGYDTVTKLYNQWNCGLLYLRENILRELPGYLSVPDLGVITRVYDEDRMKRLRDEYRKHCDEIENVSGIMTLSQRKKRTDIGKYRAGLRAAQAILDRTFQPEDEADTYNIQIRLLCQEGNQVYKTRFPI